MIDIDKKLELFAVGTVSDFLSEYIADEITQIIKNKEKPIDITASNYLSAIIAGGFTNLVDVKGFAAAALGVGLSYVVQNVFAKMKGEEFRSPQELLTDFIFDSILVFYIILIIKKILDMLSIKIDEKSSFSEKVLYGLIDGTVINLVLNLKD